MPDHDRPDPTQPPADAEPVLFFHAGGGVAAADDWISELAELGLRVFCHRDIRGFERTDNTAARIGALCAEIRAAAPGRALIVLRAPLQFGQRQLDAVATALAGEAAPLALTSFSNAEPELNPFAGVPEPDLTGTAQPLDTAALVALLGRGQRHRLNRWPGHFVALTAAAVERLAEAEASPSNAPGVLRRAGGSVALLDRLFLPDPGAPLGRAPVLEPHESPRPTAWGGLTERLRAWLAVPPLPDALPLPDHPVTLHITHSWGGGVATWVRAYIDADTAGVHLQLRSEGPQTGQGAGQKMALYLANHLDAAIDEWWLQPPIRSVDTDNAQYGEVLDQVISRFGVGRVLVSSLVGHALEALKSSVPTVQILHDHFPAWPLLGVHPQEYDADLTAAMADPRATEPFADTALEDWQALSEHYRDAAKHVRLAAPSRSVVEVQSSLHPDWQRADIQIIPHGMPPLPSARPVMPRPRPDGRLRLLIPGRVQAGKGAQLLDDALDALTPTAQVYLLGTGKGGERFFGRAGVNVVLEYDRDRLPELLVDIGPHLAALLSVVPETFSYTLSEMNALGVPVIATRVGSFLERIHDGENGWLIDPTPEALGARLAELAGEPARIDRIRSALADDAPGDMADMIAAYDALCPPAPPAPAANPSARAGDQTLAQAQAAAWRYTAELRRDQLTRAAEAIKDELRDVRRQLTTREEQVAEQDAELRRRARHNQLLDQDIERLQGTIEELLQSRSWRLTAPLRSARGLAAGFRHARAWNPMRWPWLAAHLVRNARTRGWRAALSRARYSGAQPAPATDPSRYAARTDAKLPAALPSSDDPRVSIVIPAYNRFEHTTACLASLAEARCQVPFEVIVADDASTDKTARRLTGVKGLRHLRGEDNLGFIGNCNRAAAEARGEFVCFLNNDTEVMDGWLDALVDTFERRADAGMAGARLVYPDGRLQECGGLIFSDGSGWNYGRGDDPDRPEYQYLRETDYCSGACLMLRRELWQALGGFDQRYAPAYYEDTDLAFRVRERGLKVYVQPAATVIHHEGVTSGTDLASGVKRYQAVNRDKFMARWADELARQPAPLTGPGDAAGLRRARDHRLRGRVLLVDAYTPEPDQDSGSVRLVQLMRCLRDMGYGVTFFADNRGHDGRYTAALQAEGVEAWYDPWLRSPSVFLRDRGRDFSQVFVSRHYVAANYLTPLRKWAPQAKFVFDTVDLHYLREQRQAALENSTALKQAARQTRHAELAVIRAADATLVVSEVEREVLADDAPGSPVFILSNIHDVNGRARGFAERHDLYFVGGYQHPPNIDAAKWFVDEIWPRVRVELPDARFHLVGSKATPEVRELGACEGVKFHGFVEDMRPFLDSCRISVAPLRYGAGVKGKVNQAMAHGQPVVATTVAIEGLHAEDGREVLVADDAEAFARAVVRLYQDRELWVSISEAGIDNVRRHFSREAARRDIETLFNALTQ